MYLQKIKILIKLFLDNLLISDDVKIVQGQLIHCVYNKYVIQ